MGEIAEGMIDGTYCSMCCCYLGAEQQGTCEGCTEQEPKKNKKKNKRKKKNKKAVSDE